MVGNNATLRARIVIADDHPLYRDALRQMLDRHPNLTVVAEAANGRDAVELCRRRQPELVLMDVRMPTMDGIAATRVIKQELPLTIVLMLTALEDPQLLSEALRAGAGGYVLKHAGREEVVAAIRRALSGELPIDSALSCELLRRLYTQTYQEEPTADPTDPTGSPVERRAQQEHPLLASLTPREEEVLRLIARGQTNQQIANNLHVSLNTVKSHVRRLMTKLKVSDRTQAAVLAIEMGLQVINEE
jgi:DNA-binding NarL/FixJ family response regulator